MNRPTRSPVPATAGPYCRRGWNLQGWIKAFFGGNAALAIIILVLIIVFLLREGIGFFPGYRRELELYRKSGQEYVDGVRSAAKAHEQLASLLNRAYAAEVNSRCAQPMARRNEALAVVAFFNEKTSGPRAALARVAADARATPPAVVERIRRNFRMAMAACLPALPPTPSLGAAERARLLEQLSAREPALDTDPPLLVALGEELAARQAEAGQPLAGFREAIDAFELAADPLTAILPELVEETRSTRETAVVAAIQARDAGADAAALEAAPVDFAGRAQALAARVAGIEEASGRLLAAIDATRPGIPAGLDDPGAARLLAAFHKAWPRFAQEVAAIPASLRAWRWDEPVGVGAAVVGFLTGREWITGGEWSDFYGILPLLVGSVLIAVVALALAIPLGVGAAIYTNQLARRREQQVIKPVIEFIQAIPSVVLGFIGIAVVGTLVRDASAKDWLQWVPGFPIQERLNILTAGALLGLMAIPTIFTLAEDALNNVPEGFSEASEALGASRMQTIFRVVVPAALSGILAAVLLGLGRVIGETMVVLLVAGNRIKIPDFSAGLGVFFQPAHTLTGIIAQELGEVPYGSVHYRALFMVGVFLFAVALLLNWLAQKLLLRFKSHAA